MPLVADEVGPVLELWAELIDVRRKRVGVDVPTEDVGAEEGFGFDGHDVLSVGGKP